MCTLCACSGLRRGGAADVARCAATPLRGEHPRRLACVVAGVSAASSGAESPAGATKGAPPRRCAKMVGKDGGKAKPLKQAKKGPKEYDEVRRGLVARYSPAPSGGALPVREALRPVPAALVCRTPQPVLTDALCCTWWWLAMIGRHGVPGEEEARGQGAWRGGKVLDCCWQQHGLTRRLLSALQELAALKAKAGEKGAFGGKGLAYSGKK